MKKSTTNTFGCDAAHNHAGKMIGHSGGEMRLSRRTMYNIRKNICGYPQYSPIKAKKLNFSSPAKKKTSKPQHNKRRRSSSNRDDDEKTTTSSKRTKTKRGR